MSPLKHLPAPGGPGLEPRWTSSAKSGVGTAFDGRSLVWFTISHGILDEVYYPRVDQANTRDFGLLITDAGRPDEEPFFSEEKRDAGSVVHLLAAGVPGYRLINTCTRGRYQIEKTIVTDPERDVIVQRIRFRPLVGTLESYRVFALLAPHIGNQGFGNDAWCDEYKGIPMLFAQRADVSLALACSCDWRARSCGYVGVSDGWRQLRDERALIEYTEARNGNIALTGEVDLAATTRTAGNDRVAEFVLALGFGSGPAEAAQRARMTLASKFDAIADTYVREWQSYHQRTLGPEPPSESLDPDEMRVSAEHEVATGADRAVHNGTTAGSGDPRDRTPAELPASVIDLYYTSAAVLACHEDKRAIGALIASLSIPWGQSKGDHELGGYHLVWPRDLVESAGALMAAGHCNLARRTLRYLMSTQEADGQWPQNMWLDGRAYWRGIQMDETAFPILFAELLRREDELKDIDPWPMVRKAAAFVVRHGPVTQQDRWEEDGGYSPFTLAVEIAALIVAADFADAAGQSDCATLLRETADAWNDNVERWTYVTGTEFARLAGVDGYYTRIAPPESADGAAGMDSLPAGYVSIRNRPAGSDRAHYENLVSPDALALVRLGLRDANDERIVNTVRVIDALLCRSTKAGPVWYRYNNDGYGEHEDGSPFDGVGIGRGWPLLAGERAHYELARGRPYAAVRLLGVMRAQTSDGGMLPEQVWDAQDVPDKELFNGRPSGSAMPLVWAHAEYVKLVRSLRDGVVFDMPDRPYDRYVRNKMQARYAIWSAANKTRMMRLGRTLRVQTDRPALVHWTADGWSTTHDTIAREVGLLGVWVADLETSALGPGAAVEFTLNYPAEHRWENVNYRVALG
ncbi:MAG: glycoside hydrolase family 15 protein [Gemmatimonadaceae bacterium]